MIWLFIMILCFRPLATKLEQRDKLREDLRQTMIQGEVPDSLINELNSVTKDLQDCDELEKWTNWLNFLKRRDVTGFVYQEAVDKVKYYQKKERDELDNMRIEREGLRIMSVWIFPNSLKYSREYYRLDREIKARERIDTSA